MTDFKKMKLERTLEIFNQRVYMKKTEIQAEVATDNP